MNQKSKTQVLYPTFLSSLSYTLALEPPWLNSRKLPSSTQSLLCYLVAIVHSDICSKLFLGCLVLSCMMKVYIKKIYQSLCFACNSQFSLSQVITGIFKNILVLFTSKSTWLSYNLHAINDAHFKGVEFHGFHQTYTIMNHNSNQIQIVTLQKWL